MQSEAPGGSEQHALSWKGSSALGRIKLVVFALIPVVALVFAANLFAAVSIERSQTLREDSLGHAEYEFRMGRWPWSHRSVTPLNSLGFADEEFDRADPKGACVHVLFAGDSFVFGDGVDRSESFVQLIRDSVLARPSGRCIRIFNVAERATTIEQQSARIRENLDRLQPDVIILGQYQNDLTDLTKPGFAAHSGPDTAASIDWETPPERFSVFRASLVRYLSYHTFAALTMAGAKYDLLRHWSVLADGSSAEEARRLIALYRTFYDPLVDDLRERGIPFGLVIFPSKFDILAGRSPEDSLFRALAVERDLPFLSLFPVLDSARRPYPYLRYDGHLNEHGNRVVAEAIYRWLFLSPAVPFPVLSDSSNADVP